MLFTNTIKNVENCQKAGAKIYEMTTPKTGVNFEFPVFDKESIVEIDQECLIVLLNRRLKDDYRNMANRPESFKKRGEAIADDASLTEDEKLAQYAKLFGK